MVYFGESSGSVGAVPIDVLGPKGAMLVTRPTLATFIATREQLVAGAEELFDALRSGMIGTPGPRSYPLRDAATAHRDLEGRRSPVPRSSRYEGLSLTGTPSPPSIRYGRMLIAGDWYEEIFGPVLVATRWRDEAEAVRIANDTHFGLAAYVWSRDIGQALRTAHAVDAGWVQVNRGGGQQLGQSFGGVKQSGLGRECSLEGMLEGFTERKSVTVNLASPVRAAV